MKLRTAMLLGAVALGLGLVVWSGVRWSARARGQRAMEAEQRLQRALDATTAVAAQGVPLAEVLDRLAIRHGVEFEIDESSLRGHGAREPVSVELSGVSLRAALAWILGQLDLDFFCAEGRILVTTKRSYRAAAARYVATVHPLAAAPAGWRAANEEQEEVFTTAIESILAADDWPSVKSGEVLALPNALLAVEMPHVHERIAYLLDQMAGLHQRRDARDPIYLSASDNSPAELALRQKLAQKVHVEFFRATLEDACRFLAADRQLPIVFDRRAMAAAKTDTRLPLTINVRDVPLGSALTQLLTPLGLTWEIRQELLVVAPPPEGRFWPAMPRLYFVGDLTRREPRRGGEGLRAGLEMVSDLSAHTDSFVHVVGENLLLVQAPAPLHEADVQWLLDRLREFLAPGEPSRYALSAPQRLRAVLQQPAHLVFEAVPLGEIIPQIGRQYGIDVRVDEAAFSGRERDLQESLTCSLVDGTLEAALERLLAPWGLIAQQRDAVVWVTTDWASSGWQTRDLYDLRPLLDPDYGLLDQDELERLIRWQVQDRGAAVSLFGGILIVRAAEPAQRLIAQLLTSLAAHLDRLPKPAQIAELAADLTAHQVLAPLQLADDPGAVAYVEFVQLSCRAFEE